MTNSEKIKIIDEVFNTFLPSDSPFDTRKCLTYIDEFEHLFNSRKRAICLVSITFLKEHYIKFTEKTWLEKIRNKYGFPKGYPIHFTNLRNICKEVRYQDSDGTWLYSNGWNDEYLLFKYAKQFDFDNKKFHSNITPSTQKKFIDSYHLWTLFRKLDDSNRYILDIKKLQDFYDDIYEVIRDSKFNILCTSILHNPSSHIKEVFQNNQRKSSYTIAFTHHLDLLCFFLNHGFYTKQEKTEMGSLYERHFSTKLRWDGDDGFNTKADYRSAFNQCISLGTTQYTPEIVRGCLEEIRFINKQEIGYYDNLEDQRLISHIGCDLADFIAYYIGKISIKSHIITDLIESGLSSDEAEARFEDNISFNLGNRTFSPYKDLLHEKILSSTFSNSIQVINECAYLK